MPALHSHTLENIKAETTRKIFDKEITDHNFITVYFENKYQIKIRQGMNTLFALPYHFFYCI